MANPKKGGGVVSKISLPSIHGIRCEAMDKDLNIGGHNMMVSIAMIVSTGSTRFCSYYSLFFIILKIGLLGI